MSNSDRTEQLIERFSAHMLQRMLEHADRGDWSTRPLTTFLRKFLEKHLEIAQAIEDQDWTTVGQRCVDAANHNMMLADRVGYLYPRISED